MCWLAVCWCARPRVFAEDRERCHRCGRNVRDYIITANDLAEALVRLALDPIGKRPHSRIDPK